METKKCNICNIEQDINNFHRKGEGHSYMCKDCRKIYIRKHYLNNKKTYIKQAAESRKRTQVWWKNYKDKLSCNKCGEDHPACLDFHHKDPNKKEYAIAKMIQRFSRKKIITEIKKCIVLCANCHRKLHHKAP